MNFDIEHFEKGLHYYLVADLTTDVCQYRSNTIARFILEAAMTFDPSERYEVVVVVPNLQEWRSFQDSFKEVVRSDESMREEYSEQTFKVNDCNFILTMKDWDMNERIWIKGLILEFFESKYIRGYKFHNYFVNVRIDSFFFSEVLSLLPMIKLK